MCVSTEEAYTNGIDEVNWCVMGAEQAGRVVKKASGLRTPSQRRQIVNLLCCIAENATQLLRLFSK